MYGKELGQVKRNLKERGRDEKQKEGKNYEEHEIMKTAITEQNRRQE